MEQAQNKYLANNINSGLIPAEDFSDELRTKVMPMAPTGMTQLCITDGSMTEANEAAILNAIKSFADKNNIQDWSSIKVAGFDNGYHGSAAATLSASS